MVSTQGTSNHSVCIYIKEVIQEKAIQMLLLWKSIFYTSDRKNPKKKLLKCDLCEKVICTSVSFTKHFKSHTGEKPLYVNYVKALSTHGSLMINDL